VPNGNDKDWIRFCAVEGFRLEFARWPTIVRIHPERLENIRDHILSPRGFARIAAKIKVISDKRTLIIAMDETGARYIYKKQGFPKDRSDPFAVDWLENPEYRSQ
jgi:hypothetical protein